MSTISLAQRSLPCPVWIAQLLLGLIVFGLSLLGILTRAPGLLAALWPANAVMLGLLVRFPVLNRPAGWIFAIAGYLLADLLTHSSLLKAGLLTVANLAGVVVGCYLFTRRPEADQALKSPLAVLRCVWISIMAALAAGAVGTIANPVLFHRSAWHGMEFWFATELVHYLAILPVLLTFPRNVTSPEHLFRVPGNTGKLLALLALSGSQILAVVIKGPGALAFPIPALLWCAAIFSLFESTVITFFATLWTLYAVSVGVIDLATGALTESLILSIRTGIIFITLSPLAVASMIEVRNDMLRQMAYLANHDALTGLLNRAGFWQSANAVLLQAREKRQHIAVLMLDIDHFKRFNDTYGHAAGDVVLAEVSRTIKKQFRNHEILGRVGGEEFAAIFQSESSVPAASIAKRIVDAVSQARVILSSGETISVTISIGTVTELASNYSLDDLLDSADSALYQAKESGRNRVRNYRSATAP